MNIKKQKQLKMSFDKLTLGYDRFNCYDSKNIPKSFEFNENLIYFIHLHSLR